MKEFYLTLRSDHRGLHDVANEAHSFKIHLARELFLSGKWEVGISEIFYPMTMSMFANFDVTTGKTLPSGKSPSEKTKLNTISIGSNNKANVKCFYDDYEAVIKNLNKSLLPNHIKVSEKKGVCTFIRDIESSKHELYVGVHDDIKDFLGLNDNEFELMSFYTCPKRMDFRQLLPEYLMICTDIIDCQLVGNLYYPVLAFVPVKNESYSPGLIGHHSFNVVKYFKINHERIDDIGFHLRDHNGNDISFDYGSCTVTLHFRKLQ